MTTIVTDIPAGVETVQFVQNQQVDQTNRSSGALHFGTIGPGEESRIVIVAFRFKTVKAFTNIKIGLINTGGLSFTNDLFGITTSPAFDTNLVPDEYFEGVNSTGLASNEYNIDVDNRTSTVSEYVYLNINLPANANFGAGVVRYKWFFDYDD